MPKPDLTDEEHAAVANLVRQTVADTRFPFSDRIRILRAALAKLDPSSAPITVKVTPLPTGPMVGSRRKARR
jgi:hypothetical protein